MTTKYTYKIEQDQDAMNPLEWDQLGTIVCWHSRYDLGEEHRYANHGEFAVELSDDTGKLAPIHTEYYHCGEYWEESINAAWKVIERYYFVLPIYIYDHSGICLSTSGFSCPWDSGQVGYIYISKEKVRKEYSVKRISKQLKDRVLSYLENEVKTYSAYVSGQVYGYIVENEEGENIESGWGYYDYRDAETDAKDTIIYLQEQDQKEENQLLARLEMVCR